MATPLLCSPWSHPNGSTVAGTRCCAIPRPSGHVPVRLHGALWCQLQGDTGDHGDGGERPQVLPHQWHRRGPHHPTERLPQFVHSKNRAALSYSLALNHLADRTAQEMAAMRGRRWSGDPKISLHTPSVVPLSPGAVTPVKDQAVCGSCWSFATTGAMEGALFLKTGVLTPLSQQVLIDCSWGFGNYACDGGEEWRAYEWIKKHGGIASTESYGPYLGQNGYCHYNQSELVAPLAGYVTVEPGNAEALKAALFKHGPIAVNIDASHKSFTFYANGVYEEPHCGEGLDHAVLAVGYGVLHGKSYWLIKNSWSTYWGNDGYILMAMKDNNCGVATAASFPILA
uniref:Peptidase C1A papain C-terminal domain-containing protein n=1 Tax=Coturnix japonica TaxID=93934 RepID=A0A8C2U1U0_COTJA